MNIVGESQQSLLLFRWFLLFIDAMIAIQFYQLVSNLLSRQQQQQQQQQETDDDNNNSNKDDDISHCSELHLMTYHMNPKLHPSYQMLQIFPISSSSTFSPIVRIHPTQDSSTSTSTPPPSSTEKHHLQHDTSNNKTTTLSSWIPWNDLPIVVALLYYMNPVTILATIASSHHHSHDICVQNLITLLILYTIHVSTKKRSETSIVHISFLISILSYIDCHYTLLAIPISLLVATGQPQSRTNENDDGAYGNQYNTKLPTRTVILPMFVLYIIFTIVLHTLSGLLVGFQNYYPIFVATHLSTFHISNLQPNLSLLWYFGMEIFIPFHRYFTFLLGGVPYFTVIPMTIRLYQYPSVLVSTIYSHRLSCSIIVSTPLTFAMYPFLMTGRIILDVRCTIPTFASYIVSIEYRILFHANESTNRCVYESNTNHNCDLCYTNTSNIVQCRILDVVRTNEWGGQFFILSMFGL